MTKINTGALQQGVGKRGGHWYRRGTGAKHYGEAPEMLATKAGKIGGGKPDWMKLPWEKAGMPAKGSAAGATKPKPVPPAKPAKEPVAPKPTTPKPAGKPKENPPTAKEQTTSSPRYKTGDYVRHGGQTHQVEGVTKSHYRLKGESHSVRGVETSVPHTELHKDGKLATPGVARIEERVAKSEKKAGGGEKTVNIGGMKVPASVIAERMKEMQGRGIPTKAVAGHSGSGSVSGVTLTKITADKWDGPKHLANGDYQTHATLYGRNADSDRTPPTYKVTLDKGVQDQILRGQLVHKDVLRGRSNEEKATAQAVMEFREAGVRKAYETAHAEWKKLAGPKPSDRAITVSMHLANKMSMDRAPVHDVNAIVEFVRGAMKGVPKGESKWDEEFDAAAAARAARPVPKPTPAEEHARNMHRVRAAADAADRALFRKYGGRG